MSSEGPAADAARAEVRELIAAKGHAVDNARAVDRAPRRGVRQRRPGQDPGPRDLPRRPAPGARAGRGREARRQERRGGALHPARDRPGAGLGVAGRAVSLTPNTASLPRATTTRALTRLRPEAPGRRRPMIKLWSELPRARSREMLADFSTLIWVVFWSVVVVAAVRVPVELRRGRSLGAGRRRDDGAGRTRPG